jgi:hypothetical protein
MASQDTIDSVYIHTVTNNEQFQERCWLRFLIAAFGVTAEDKLATATAVTASGAATLTFLATPASITGLVAINLTNAAVIPVGAKVSSVTATTAVLDHNVIGAGVAIGDNISFAPAQHAERARLAGALFTKNVDLMMLANAVLSDATNRTNCLADKTLPGGNITDAGIDSQVTAIYTGLAKVRGW